MGFAELLVLALGLAMDATAVAAMRGFVAAKPGSVGVRARDVVVVALLFGGAQAVMPAFGWYLGEAIGPLARAFDHWIAFVLLGGLGAKMLWEARGANDDGEKNDVGGAVFSWRVLVPLAVATSIDAFAVGITLPILEAPLLLSLVTIGVTTALCSGVAVVVGRRVGSVLGEKLELAGGLVLIALGTKILVEHLSAG